MTQHPDPIFELICRWRQARANFNAAVGAATDATYEDVAAAAGDAIREAELAIIRTPPRTLAGAVGVLQFVRSDLGAGREGICDGDEDWADLCFRSRPRSPPRRVRRPRSPRTSDNTKENDQVA